MVSELAQLAKHRHIHPGSKRRFHLLHGGDRLVMEESGECRRIEDRWPHNVRVLPCWKHSNIICEIDPCHRDVA